MFENRMLRRIFGPERAEATEVSRKLHSEELQNLCCSPSIIRIIKSRMTTCSMYERKKKSQGYFCDGMSWNAIPEVLPQKNANLNGIPEPFSLGTGITNTTLLLPNIESLFAFQNFLQKKNSPEKSIQNFDWKV
jgi:hypothetical protein